MIVLDKAQLAENITYLVKRKNIPLGEFERSVGVSPGYFARLKQPEKNDLKPSIDLLTKVANRLECSLETLLFVNTSKVTETEIYLANVLDKFINNTKTDAISWNTIRDVDFFNGVINANDDLLVDRNTSSSHYDFKFKSKFFEDDDLDLCDKIFELNRVMQDFYIFKLCLHGDKTQERFEMYLLRSNKLHKLCCGSSDEPNRLFELLRTLYETIQKSFKRVRIDADVKEGLDEFLSDEDDKLPF